MQHASLEVDEIREALHAEEHACLTAAVARATIHDDFAIAIRFEFVKSRRKFAERNQH